MHQAVHSLIICLSPVYELCHCVPTVDYGQKRSSRFLTFFLTDISVALSAPVVDPLQQYRYTTVTHFRMHTVRWILSDTGLRFCWL